MKFVVNITACLVLTGLFPLPSAAQETTPATNAAPAAQTQSQPRTQGQNQAPTPQTQTDKKDKDQDKDSQPQSGQGKVKGTSNDRLFYALPNFLTLKRGENLPPLTAKDKFKVVAQGTFDYVQYPWWGMISAVGQAADSEPAYGQGWLSYAKRYGTTAADSTIENFMVGAVFPSILRQDPRFYYSEDGRFGRRLGYAVSRIFVSRSDSGKAQFNYSEIFGSATAAAISTYSYHPKSTYIRTPTNPHLFIPSDRTLINTSSVWATQLTLDTITIVIKEFWPDVHRKMARKTRADPPAVGGFNRQPDLGGAERAESR